MAIEVLPATDDRDVETMVGPKQDPNGDVCWCLSYRVSPKDNRALTRTARGRRVAALLRAGEPIGALGYDDGEVVGWAGLAPRSSTSFATNRRIPHVDDLDVWSVWCIRVRPGHRGQGIAHVMLEGAVRIAREAGAPAIEGHPVDTDGAKVDRTMAYVGTRALFERAGFAKAADTTSRLDGFPRVVMRLDLR